MRSTSACWITHWVLSWSGPLLAVLVGMIMYLIARFYQGAAARRKTQEAEP